MKRKTAKKTPVRKSRRRRVGASSGGNDLMQAGVTLAGFLAGTIAAQTVNKMIEKSSPGQPVNQKIVGVVLGGLGYFLPQLAGKSPMVKSLGLGITIAGGSILLKDLKAINGIGNRSDVVLLPMSSGAKGVNSMVNGNGAGVSSMVNGRPNMNARRAVMFDS
jgi:hypothetical protein